MNSVRRGPRRSRLRFLLLAGLVALFAGGAGLAFATSDRPSVTFTGSGSPPLTCSSTPEVTDIRIVKPTKIVLINRTGTSATIFVGGREVVSLGNGMAVRVNLHVGQHTVELRPDCLIEQPSVALVVTVAHNGGDHRTTPPTGPPTSPKTPHASGPPGGTVPVPSASPDDAGGDTGNDPGAGNGTGNQGKPGTAGTEATETGSPAGDSGAAGGYGDGARGVTGPGGEASGREVSDSEGAGSGGDYGPVGSDGGDAPMIETEFGSIDAPYLAIPPLDNRGSHLLAVIALICLIGVTLGIIRAILAQRTDNRLVGRA